MAHLVKDIGWGTVDFVLHEHRIFFQQRWLYEWKVAAGQSNWTYEQKRAFHTQVDRLIWRSWSNKVKLTATGDRKYTVGGPWPMNLDVRWVTRKAQWTVEVTKVAPGTTGVGEVFWATKRIKLNTGDLKDYRACTSQPAATQVCKDNFNAIPHEFGHAVGNTSALNRGDEYRATSPNLADTESILNIGKQLRTRHFTTMIEEINKMTPGTTWTVHSVG